MKPGANVTKLFYSLDNPIGYRVWPWQPSIMSVSKVGVYPSGAPERCSNNIRLPTNQPRLKRLAIDKYFSLFGLFVSYKEKKVLLTRGQCSNVHGLNLLLYPKS
jgi:hypothetical protein